MEPNQKTNQPMNNIQKIQQIRQQKKEEEEKLKNNVEEKVKERGFDQEELDKNNLMYKEIAALDMRNEQIKITKLAIAGIILNVVNTLANIGAGGVYQILKIIVTSFTILYFGYMIFKAKSKKQYLENKYLLK